MPDNVDPASVEIIAASHPYTFSMHENGELAFIFNNIMLPDSNTNEAASHGYIIFKVKPLNALPLGESIKNKAHIYFDFNDAIITNDAVTEIRLTSKTDTNRLLKAKVYPNPDAGQTKVELSENIAGRVFVYSLNGAFSKSILLENGSAIIPTDDLQNGI